MLIRPSRAADLPALLQLYQSARAFMSEAGNPNQWGNTNPTEEMVRDDIAGGVSYVLEDLGLILAVFALLPGPDPTYRYIEGSWPNEKPYGVIHRMACALHGKGLGSVCLDWCKRQFDCLRIDTHQDNRPMQTLIGKNGFQRCGIIYLANGDPRIAYQWDRPEMDSGGKSGLCPGGLSWKLAADGTLTVSGAGSDTQYLPDIWAELWQGKTPLRQSEIDRLVIAPGVAAIGDSAFDGCINLREVILPGSVRFIGMAAFRNCTRLTSILLPVGLAHIGDYAFQGCSSLTELTIPHGTRSIGVWAFQGCARLERVTVPETVTSIGSCAFYCRKEGTVICGKAGSYAENYLLSQPRYSPGPRNRFSPLSFG